MPGPVLYDPHQNYFSDGQTRCPTSASRVCHPTAPTPSPEHPTVVPRNLMPRPHRRNHMTTAHAIPRLNRPAPRLCRTLDRQGPPPRSSSA